MQAGQIILSGVTDEEMVTIFQAKEKSGGKLMFLPVNIQIQQVQGSQKQVYSNVTIHWMDQTGAKAAAALLNDLAK
jgi:hypothetical protein